MEIAANMSELAFVDWLRRQVADDPRVELGIGDDAAVLPWPGTRLVITTDMLLEGSCFTRQGSSPRRIGRKAMAVNLSDLAAMAARPVAALISVGLPRSFSRGDSEELFAGIRDLAAEFNVALIGGDTNSWEGPLVINIALLGDCPDGPPVARRGAEVGDWLFVTGPLGGSILGHHYDFTPRVREALALRSAVPVKAMIDISDGLALDLHRLCRESRVGAVLDEEKIPISSAALQMKDGRSPLQHALTDGEDFELLFVVAADDGGKLLRDPPSGCDLHHIGEVVANGVSLRHQDGSSSPLAAEGYVHQFGRG